MSNIERQFRVGKDARGSVMLLVGSLLAVDSLLHLKLHAKHTLTLPNPEGNPSAAGHSTVVF